MLMLPDLNKYEVGSTSDLDKKVEWCVTNMKKKDCHKFESFDCKDPVVQT